MLYFFILLALCMLTKMQICTKGIDKEYIAKDNTQVIKGAFILIVFMSHIRGYAAFESQGDLFCIKVLNYIGQLMVAMFLFYGGYGVFEAVKSKGKSYIDNFGKKRIGKVWLDFASAVLIFLAVDAVLGKSYSAKHILLSFTGWTSIGNSNWYMFAIFTLYIFTFVIFKFLWKNKTAALTAMTICSFGYIFMMPKVKEYWWSDTYLCYVLGMWYSFFKTKIEEAFEKNIIAYYISTIAVIVFYFLTKDFCTDKVWGGNIIAVFFCLSIVFVTMKIRFKNKLIMWCGENLFWIYILQRLPMMIFTELGLNVYNVYIFFVLSFISTVLLTIGAKRAKRLLP